jgi:ABC-type polysaccharide/polyol phosphate export permease
VIALARHCIRYRELLSAFIVRELRARYRGSLLGGLWMVLQPVVFLLVYYTVFVKFLSFKMVEGLPEETAAALDPRILALLKDPATRPSMSALGMFVALIPWTALAECVSRATGTIFENGNMIKKIAFPSELLPIYLVGYNLVNVLVGFGVFIAAALFAAGLAPAWHLLPLLPLVLLLQAVFMLGVAYLVSTATVFIRDLAQLVPLVITVWFFFSPIFYFGLPPDAKQYDWLLRINPVYHLLAMYRAIFIFQPVSASAFPWASLGIFSAVAFGLAYAGYRVFTRFKADFADEL